MSSVTILRRPQVFITVPSALTQSQLLEYYLASRAIRPATIRSFRLMWHPWIAFAGDVPANEVTATVGVAYRTEVLSRASSATWNSYLTHLRTVYNCAVANQLIEINPFHLVPRAPVVHKRKLTVGHETLQLAMNTLAQGQLQMLRPHWFWRVVLQALYYTGMRRHQLISLRWRDVDFDEGTLRMAAEGSKIRREWLIPLASEWANSLQDLRRRTIDVLGRSKIDDEQVFNVTLFYPRYRGAEMTDEHLSGFFRRLSTTIGYTITAHRLRHTTATELMRRTHNDIKGVQTLLGHTDVRMTLEYVETDLKQLRAGLHKLPKLE